MKEILKSANIFQSYERIISLVFFDSRCILVAHENISFRILAIVNPILYALLLTIVLLELAIALNRKLSLTVAQITFN